MPQPDLADLLDRLERKLGRWDELTVRRTVDELLDEPDQREQYRAYSQWMLRRSGHRSYEIRTIAGDVGRGDTPVDAVADLLAYLP